MLKKRIKSFGFAIKGIATLFQTQVNAQIHLTALFLVICAGVFFHINTTEWCFIALVSAAVLSAEAVNTAIEFVVDLVSPQYHPLAEKAKDVAAGAVLLMAFGAVVVGFLIFLPKIWAYFQ
ncbi:MAG: diacylglycerol kinase family protein [Saprospiraceae bacterium]|nr:diacylglycerol kinase family protein [Saprospiraceae bacterium]